MSAGTRVGYQGEAGAFSEAALLRLLPEAEAVPRWSFQDVVRAVEDGEDDAGLLPVENTLAGGVAAAWDAMHDGDVHAVREVVIPIRHCLLALPGSDPEALREVRSHPVALAQCEGFFRDRPGLRRVAVHDTAGAAREVSEAADPGLAAIAAGHAAERYGLAVLARDLQDRNDNQTRFFLIRRGAVEGVTESGDAPAGLMKTALVAEAENRPGTLHELLGIFASRGMDLTFIQSRPAGTPWTYRFILEFRHPSLEAARRCLEAAREVCRALRVLGTFPA